MKATILLIDDSKGAPSLRALLVEHGYEVLWAMQGEVGVLLAQLRHPDLILLNPEVSVLGEPGGILSYIEDTRRKRGIPVCAISSPPNTIEDWEGIRAPDGVLDRSANPQDVLAEVKACLVSPRGARPNGRGAPS